MLSRYRPFLHLLLLLFSLLPSHDSLAVNRKRVTFLPYGDSFKPTDRALAADAALRVGIGYRCAAEKRVLAAGATVVLRESQLLLVRLPTPPPALSTFRDEGVAVIPLSAGPFESRDDAVAVLRRWKTNYFECHRLDKDDLEGREEKEEGSSLGGGNSCFEFGGCHQRCWWREDRVIGAARVTRCTMVDTGRGFYEEELLRLLNANKDGSISPSLSSSFRRDGPERSGGNDDEREREQHHTALELEAALVNTRAGYYCNLIRI